MNFVPEGTELCGLYTCAECGMRYLDLKIMPQMTCPYCGTDFDMEIGPDETLPENIESAKLDRVVEGEEEIIMLDKLLNVAFECDDESWL